MSNIHIEAGRHISKQLLPSEDAIDGSIIQNAKPIALVEGGFLYMPTLLQLGAVIP